jgi:hypothetical protein
MKFAILILKASIAVQLVFVALYIAFFCIGDGIDPIETETVVIGLITALGLILNVFLIRRAGRISPVTFWISFVLFLLVFTLPALVHSCIIILFMMTG